MKVKLLVAAMVIMTILASMPIVTADITISDVTYTPAFPKEGDKIHVKAKVTATENISVVRLLNCWEKPVAMCGSPKTMTDDNKDSYYEVDASDAAWTTGNIIHLNISVEAQSGAEKLYTIPPITIGTTGPVDPANITTETDCKKAGYFWWNGTCHSKAQTASDFTDKPSCEGAGHFWWANKCNEQKGTPDKYTDKDSCRAVGFYWWANKCNESPQPPDGGKFLPTFEGGLVFTAMAVAGLAFIGRKARRKK
jgi:hypothetical protein